MICMSGKGHIRLDPCFSRAVMVVRSKRPLQPRMDRGRFIVGRLQWEVCCSPCCPVSRQVFGIDPLASPDGRTGTVIVEPLLLEWATLSRQANMQLAA